MKDIGIFFGSDTGNTESIAYLIHDEFKPNVVKIHDISNSSQADLESFSTLIFGVPTWYYGEIQCDWEDFLPTLRKTNLDNKIIALFGCGDQEDYSEYFCDAIGILYNEIKYKNITLVGKWPIAGYSYISSKAMLNNNFFYGLVLDQDRQPELSFQRVKSWVNQITDEIYTFKNK
ncbi:Flavodoxin 1 [Buchnera aphidicola (Eriosoma lanigerum)]|uniref:flavodoxin FldA n=1 Tax=Buchnera aphidicola TaxID=9 RepID=UPI0034640842